MTCWCGGADRDPKAVDEVNQQRTTITMSSLRVENPLSSTNSVNSNSSSCMEQLPPNKYYMKTLCFAKKSQMMPNKDDYAKLLRCGLGKQPVDPSQSGPDLD